MWTIGLPTGVGVPCALCTVPMMARVPLNVSFAHADLMDILTGLMFGLQPH